MSLKNRLNVWLGRSIGHRIRLVSVATAVGLVFLLGLVSFSLFFYQANKNFNDHSRNGMDRIGDLYEFRLSAIRNSLNQLAKSSLVVNAYVDSSGREIYLTPILRDFRLPIELPVKLILFDANIMPFASNVPDYATSDKRLSEIAHETLKTQKAQTVPVISGKRNQIVLTAPVFFPAANSYEGVLLFVVETDALLHLPDNYLNNKDCLTVAAGNERIHTINCDARPISGSVSRPVLKEKQAGMDDDITLYYDEKSRQFILQLMDVFLLYLLIGIAAITGVFWLSGKASHIFAGQFKSLSDASVALAENPNAQTLVKWQHPDEIGQFVNTFNMMVTRLQNFQMSLETLIAERTDEIRIILDNVVDGIITFDESGTIQSLNHAAETIFDCRANDIVGRHLKTLMPDWSHSGNDQSTGFKLIDFDTREMATGQRQDGSTFAMEVAISESVQNDRPLFIGVIRDITERKRIEKMKSEFVSTVSHELRTPLTSISGALGLIAGGVFDKKPEQAKKMVETAYKNSLRLAHLINDLLDMEKMVAGKMSLVLENHSLLKLVQQAFDSIGAYGEQYKVSFKLVAHEDVTVRVDSDRLIQVLNNFLSNAAKFSPPGGQVEVVFRMTTDTVRVEVVDHGEGIPTEFRSRIFVKFSQADSSDTRQRGGSGLGLAISKELIELMHGVVGFESEKGQGATFYFELPLREKVVN